MGERNWDSDYLMRRFLGEHFGNAQDDQDRELDTLEGLQNPNLMDLPAPMPSQERRAPSVGNVFWSERANEEHLLRQMRPSHLPDLDDEPSPDEAGLGRASDQTADAGSIGTEALFASAREMDRQTSVSRYQAFDALQFLTEASSLPAREHSTSTWRLGTTRVREVVMKRSGPRK